MKLSLWILREALKEYTPDIHCLSNKIEIEEIRLADRSIAFEKGILYLGTSDFFFGDNKAQIVCMHQQDYLVLHTEQLFAVSNRILSVFSHYARWADQCMGMIARGCTLSELLNMGEYVFLNPLMIVDASQYTIAFSHFIEKVFNSGELKHFLEGKTAPEEILKQFNQAHKDTFYRTGVFCLPDDYFPTSSYCKHIFVNNERFATIILVEHSPMEEQFAAHLLELFTPYIERWIQANLTADSSYHLTSYFARSLDGSPDSIPELNRRLSLFGWSDHAQKKILVAAVISEQFHFDAHLSRLLTSEAEGIYAIPYQKKLVILCNLKLMKWDDFLYNFKDIMKKNNYFGAASFTFTDLNKISAAYHQALIALKDGSAESGCLYECQTIAMKYIASLVHKHASTDLLHPILQEIADYDALHKTKFYETLFCYLKNERNHQLTSKELYIHRNTLFLRLDKIRNLWHLNLENPDERFYLLYSFYHRDVV